MSTCKGGEPPEVATVDDRIDRLVAALEARSAREERLVRALEGLVVCEQRKLAQSEHSKAKALAKAKAGPTTPEAVAEVRRRLARHRSKHP